MTRHAEQLTLPVLATPPRPPVLRAFNAFPDELVVDNFAGGGGASMGIEQAIGRAADIAINHDETAIRMHQANHPTTRHYTENIWKVDPRVVCEGLPVGLLWVSPDCRHFSVASGKAIVSKRVRALAWNVILWAKTVKPRMIILENVKQFQDWGPVDDEGHPIKEKAGLTFKIWLGKLKAQGYVIEFRTLVAADFGAPTTRKRLFLVARRDRDAIRFPIPTHGWGCSQPWVPAHEIIDWSLPCPSIFTRKTPLAQATENRIAMGIERFVRNGEPFIVRHGHYSKRTGAGLVQGAGAGLFRGQSLNSPLATVCATNDKHLVVPWIVKHYGGVVGNPMKMTLGTVTTSDSNALGAALLAPADSVDRSHDVHAFLIKYYRTGVGQSVNSPLATVTAKDTFALIEVHGEPYRIVDIGMRMLQPRELFRAQGFPDDYRIERDSSGQPFTKTQQIRLAGNSVCPPAARAIIEEQLAA